MLCQIAHNITRKPLFEVHTDSVKHCVELAVKEEVNLTNADLSHLKLAGANLTYAKLANANLSKTFLAGADLRHANLTNAILNGTILNGTSLVGANLTNADLTNADFVGADFIDAKLKRTILSYNRTITIPPLIITGGEYIVIITDQHIEIGCCVMLTEEWKNMSEETIEEIMYDEIYFSWQKWRKIILKAAKKHQKGLKNV